MIKIEIDMPANCVDCPCSYWIPSGELEGRLMCSAIQTRHSVDESLVDSLADNRPGNCPLNDVIVPQYCPTCGSPLFRT